MASAAPDTAIPDVAAQLQNLPLAILLIHPERRVHTVNGAAESLFGRSESRLRDRPISELMEFADERVMRGLADPDANFAARRMRVRLCGGPSQQVNISLSPVAQYAGWQVLVIVESGAGSSILQDEHGQDGFAVRGPEILAHEIKNPLAAIKGAAQLLERTADNGGKRLTGLITAEVDRIALLIDQMQTLTRRTMSAAGPCNIYEPIARARAILEAAHGGKVELTESFDPSIPPVLAVPESLVQIVLNLLTNALEAADELPARIMLSTRFVSGVSLRLSRQNRYVRLPVEIRISDNGPGIPDEMAEDIFSPFVSTKKNGQGLGLALVQKLVRDMNGRIAHDRDEERGLTHFRIFLPLAPGDEAGALQKSRR